MGINLSQHIRLDRPLGLAVLDASDYFNNGQIINRLQVPMAHRRQGHGTTMMRAACALADRHGITLWLDVSSYDQSYMTNETLSAWYETFGFKWYAAPCTMRRHPK